MKDSFFALKGDDNQEINGKRLMELLRAQRTIENYIYSPPLLGSKAAKTDITLKKFVNFSFARTRIQNVNFVKCIFRDCLFVESAICDCFFTDCKFINCNMYKCSIDRCHISPHAFRKCIPSKEYSYIGVSLYQALLTNCRKEYQPYFSEDALYMLKTWVNIDRIQNKKIPVWKRAGFLILDMLVRKPFGYGIRLGNLAVTMIVLIVFFSLINWQFHTIFGLQNIVQTSSPFMDSVYFTVTVMTTLGFGDIVPTTIIGKIAVSIQCLIGFSYLGIFASMLSRKISI